MQERYIQVTEDRLVNILTETVKQVLREGASALLYHFLSFASFKEIMESNQLTPSNIEKEWVNGENSISLSRTKSFREGWPVLMYSGDDGKGDDWCAVRLTIDGDKIRRSPNFHYRGKQHHLSVKPFDWAYKEYNDGDPFAMSDEHNGIFAHNGKEWMMKSDDYTTSYLPINYTGTGFVNGVGDKQGHPYSQAEDRMTTTADKIPDADRYITKIDILLLPYNFNSYNREDRESMYGIVTTSPLKDRISMYVTLKDLELERNKIRDPEILLHTKTRYENPNPTKITIKRDF